LGIPNDGRTPQDEIEEMMKAIEEDVAQSQEANDKNIKDNDIDNENKDDNNDSVQKDNDNNDGDDNSNENNNDDDNNDTFTPIKVNIGGKEIEITEQSRIQELLEKAINSEVKPKSVSKSTNDKMIEQFGISEDDLELLANVKNGDKSAMARLLKDLDVDEIDMDDAENYSPEVKYKEESEIDQVANEILADETWTKQYWDVKKDLPTDFIEKIEADASLLRSFSSHVKSGLAQEIKPLAIQHIANNGGDFLTAYDTVGKALVEQKHKEFKQEKKTEREVDKEARERMQRNKNSQSKDTFSVEDVSTMSEEELEEFQNSIANMK